MYVIYTPKLEFKLLYRALLLNTVHNRQKTLKLFFFLNEQNEWLSDDTGETEARSHEALYRRGLLL